MLDECVCLFKQCLWEMNLWVDLSTSLVIFIVHFGFWPLRLFITIVRCALLLSPRKVRKSNASYNITIQPKMKTISKLKGKKTHQFFVVGLHLLFILGLPFCCLSFKWSFFLQMTQRREGQCREKIHLLYYLSS